MTEFILEIRKSTWCNRKDHCWHYIVKENPKAQGHCIIFVETGVLWKRDFDKFLPFWQFWSRDSLGYDPNDFKFSGELPLIVIHSIKKDSKVFKP